MLILLLLNLFAVNSNAQEYSLTPTLIAEYPLDVSPTYFFKPSPDGRYFAYTTWAGNSSGESNLILDTKSGITLETPGFFDPIFSLNLRNIIVPNNISGLKIYRFEDILQQKRAAIPYFADPIFKGVYESVGILKTEANSTTYRLVIENGNRYYRDYKETLSNNGKSIEIYPVEAQKTLCGDHRFALPMISKDGLEVGGLDYSTGKSRVYRINENGETCSVVEEIGYITGKLAFSYGGRYLAFHVFSQADTLGNYVYSHIRTPKDTVSSNIYLKDRQTKAVYKLTNYADANAMYPEFLANGDIVYVLHPHDTSQYKAKFIHIKALQ